MDHIHHDNALTVLKAQPFTAEEFALIEAAAADLPWEALSPMIGDLQFPATAEAAKNAAYELIADLDRQYKGIAGVCVFAAAMYESARRFAAMGIAHKVLNDTFCCLHRMTQEYRQEFGVFGFDRGFWVWRQACGQIFRLGSLEYEYMTMTIHNGGLTGIEPGTPVVTIHIPSAADLSRAALDDSYAQARAFYAAHPGVCLKDGLPPEVILCRSWLLSPTLLTLLKETSGIRRFAQDFKIYESENESKGCFHFLFMVTEDTDPAALPANTSLQRDVKAHLMAGGGIGSGFGVLTR